jgi:hypothetical protein
MSNSLRQISQFTTPDSCCFMLYFSFNLTMIDLFSVLHFYSLLLTGHYNPCVFSFVITLSDLLPFLFLYGYIVLISISGDRPFNPYLTSTVLPLCFNWFSDVISLSMYFTMLTPSPQDDHPALDHLVGGRLHILRHRPHVSRAVRDSRPALLTRWEGTVGQSLRETK